MWCELHHFKCYLADLSETGRIQTKHTPYVNNFVVANSLHELDPLENNNPACTTTSHEEPPVFGSLIGIRSAKLTSLGLLMNPVGIFMFKVNNRNTRTRCEICSKLTIETPERRQWCRSGVFIVNLEHLSHLVLVFLLLTLSW